MLYRMFGVSLLLGVGAATPLKLPLPESALPQPQEFTQAEAQSQAETAQTPGVVQKPVAILPFAEPKIFPATPDQPQIKMSKVGNPHNPSTMFEIEMPNRPDPNKHLLHKFDKKKAELKQVRGSLATQLKKNEILQSTLDSQKTKTIRKETELRQVYNMQIEKDRQITTKDAQLQKASNDLALKDREMMNMRQMMEEM